MKKVKISLLIILMLAILTLPLNIFAHNVELDPESLISLPMMMINGSGSISINDKAGQYSLYYQWVEISNTTFNQLNNLKSELSAYKKEKKTELSNLEIRYKELKNIYDEENKKDSTSEATKTAFTNYKEAVTNYNNLFNEYNNQIESYENQMKNLTPGYNDSNWITATNNKVQADVSEFSGQKAFVLWAKCVTSSGTYYDESIYMLDGTYEENNNETPVGYTDFSKASYKIMQTTKNDNSYLYLQFSGINYNDNNTYYYYLSNNSKDVPAIDSDKWRAFGKNNPKTANINNIYELNSDIYLWIKEGARDEATYTRKEKIVVNAKKISRIPQLSIGSRLKAYFFSDYTSTYCYECISSETKRNIKYKIGKVTDINILKSIQNGESNCLEKLMEYAKADKNGAVGAVALGKDKSITSNLKLVDEQYYYVLLEVDDENGKYYSIEDVSLYQAVVGEAVGTNLFDYLSDDFKWNLPSNPSGDNTVANKPLPNTGITLAISACILVIGIVGVIAYKKYKHLDF